jgi:hypothetical protein
LFIAFAFSAPTLAGEIFSEDFSSATPGSKSGPGPIAGTAFSITGGNVDIIGVLNGSFFTCDANPGGNCLDLAGTGWGSVATGSTLQLKAGHRYELEFAALVQGGYPPSVGLNVQVNLGDFGAEAHVYPSAQNFKLTYFPPYDQLGVPLSFAIIGSFGGGPAASHGPVLSDISITEFVETQFEDGFEDL